MNGRTTGDIPEEYTFLGGRGNSVIDYCISSYSFLDIVETLNAKSKPFSDDMPLSLKLKVSLVESLKANSPLHYIGNQSMPIFIKKTCLISLST